MTSNPVVASVYDLVMAVPERTVLAAHRRWLVEELDGEVLDLGAGTGALFPYFDRLENVRVTAVEPDPAMRRQALDRARRCETTVELVDAGGAALPFADGRFDAVIGSFVFCTIPDHERALGEVSRVLRDGGEFRFLEHVRADGTAGRAHDALAPCWHAVAGGCHLDRETDRLFLSDDRFRTVEFERTGGLSGRLLPIVRGRLRRRSRSLVERARLSLPGRRNSFVHLCPTVTNNDD